MVAHSASFDYGFLAAEAHRARQNLPGRKRLCTLALSRRLGLDVPNHQLGTLARYWGVPQQRAHDAHDDAHVLSGVFAHSLRLAAQLDMPLPLVSCDGHFGPTPYPARVVKTPCPWRHPGPGLRDGEPLRKA
jgi:DNA polymerase III subunit epsilon